MMSSFHHDLDSEDEFIAVTTEFKPSFVVIIESLSLSTENGIEMYECAEFEAGGYKWRLIIYPNGKKGKPNCDDVSVYLSVAEPSSLDMSWEVHAMFSIFLHNQMANNFFCMQGTKRSLFHAFAPAWGFSKFISKSRLVNPHRGYLVNDSCVFGVEVFVFERPGTIERLSLMTAANGCSRSWTISDFSKIQEEWRSENFTAVDQCWYVSLIPGGSGEAKGRYLSLFLHLVTEHDQSRLKVKPKYTFRIKDPTQRKYHEASDFRKWVEAPYWNAGIRAFMPIADMNDPTKGFLVNDCCILEFSLAVLAVARWSP